MKQPINYVRVLQSGFGGELSVFIGLAAIANAKTRSSALRLAIKRLDRLKRDCERELEKCDE